MGADAFISFYGIEVILSQEQAEAFDQKTDERAVRARRHKLNFYLGRVTDGRNYHLLIGRKIAHLGVEADEEAVCADADFATLQEQVRIKLKEAGFDGIPQLIFKLHAHY